MRFVFLVPGMPLGDGVLERGTLGGSESSGLYLARELVRRGHEVHVFGNLQRPEKWEGVMLIPMGPQDQRTPHGAQYTAVVDSMPHDALIVQRMPQPFTRVHAARVQLWWLHDLARRRLEPALRPVRWAVDGILTPTAWHADQVCGVFKNLFKRESVTVVRNGVDTALFQRAPSYVRKLRSKRLLYTSRPERGLRYLLQPGGIMAQLAVLDPEVLLQVCTYDNPVNDPHYLQLYQELEGWGRALPNVQLLRPQTKRQLADLMLEASLLVYPTVPRREHEETSCISVMEAQCAGTPVIACDGGAVSETLGEGYGTLIPYLPDGEVDVGRFVTAIRNYLADETYGTFEEQARQRALQTYTFEQPAAALEALVAGRTSPGRHRPALLPAAPPQLPLPELGSGYAAHLERARVRGQRVAVLHDELPGVDAFTATLRQNLQVITDLTQADQLLVLSLLQAGGERTLGRLLAFNQLARPGARVAVAAVLGAARQHPWASLALDADVIEPQLKALGLEPELVPATAVLDEVTGLYGQWGWVCWTARQLTPTAEQLATDISLVPRGETLSVLMICKEDTEIEATLKTVLPIADEVVIGVDREPLGAWPSGYWAQVCARYELIGDRRVTLFALEHRPLRDGFDAARNEVLDRCTGDWVLWIDSDESLTYPRRVGKYLRDNGLEGYAVHHRHLATDSGRPDSTLKLDLPTRLFRRAAGLRFRGLVHEHPCHLPDGVPKPLHVPHDFEVMHPGYYTEEVRKARFERNLPLMLRDQEVNPDRMLGQFLMIRDLAQGIRWERTAAGVPLDVPLSAEHAKMADRGIALWRNLVAAPADKVPGNFIGEVLQFISELSIMRHGGDAVQFSYGLRLARQGLGDLDPQPQPPECVGALPTPADLRAFLTRLQDGKVHDILEEDYL